MAMLSYLPYLILGRGYVGQRFARVLGKQGVSHRLLSRAEFDYTQPGALTGYLGALRPRFVINAAGFVGWPNADACETHRGPCLFANAVLPARIAEACAAHGIPWGHVSCGSIFQGEGPGGEGFSEDDVPNFAFPHHNCSFYSGTKALGEERIRRAPQTYVWRFRAPFEGKANPRNFLTQVLSNERLLDVRFSASHLDDFVASCLACFENDVPYGTYNLTNPGSVTTREIVAELLRAGATDQVFSFFASEAEFMRVTAKAARSHCILNTRKSEDAGVALRPIRDALRAAISELLNQG